ncbi:MAG TPA: hypothetical protein VEC09_01315 [Actinomycetota bacterium]|nr:hypothetical protein [Actinomycetota bacterium]
MKHRHMIVAGALALAMVLAACGGDDDGGGETGTIGETPRVTAGETAATGSTGDTATAGSVSAEEWVAGLCTSVSTYATDMQELTEGYADTPPTGDLEEQKDFAVQLLVDAITVTEGFVEDLAAVGVPDVENGQQIFDEMTGAFDEAIAVLEEAQVSVEGIDTSDPTAFATELTNVGIALQTSSTSIQLSLGALASPELDAAALEEPACTQLAGGGTGAS